MGLENCKTTKEREVYIQSYPIGNGIAWAGFWIGIGLMIIGMSSCVAQNRQIEVIKTEKIAPTNSKEGI